MKKRLSRGGCLAAAGILFLLFFLSFRGIEKAELLETEGRNFEKAEVVEVLADNAAGNQASAGKQRVKLKLLSGEHSGKTVEANSSSGYLFGAHCKVGMKVIAIVSESNGELAVSVYSENRGPMVWLMIGIFVAVVVLVGGKKGVSSILGLGFTMLCIFFVFLPMIYQGVSPIFAAVLVVILTTLVTMCLVDGITRKSLAAMAGTVTGVIVSGIFAWIFGKVTSISGYNVSDIENLVYVGEMTDIRIGELLFAGILIAALGAVMDVGMSIASTLNELKEANPQMTVQDLFRSGMNVGRDMMGTMSNTLILAFTGGSINTLVFIYAYNYQYQQIMNMYSVGIELMQGLSSSMGVILAVPCTSLIGALLLGNKFGR
ncbi:MAG: YibE/F family protein [Lachnospiraceae bacterium]|nr:YibE/F family protein [Lachnospiraceae bacterium]